MTKERTIYGLRNILWLKFVLIALSFFYIAYKLYDFFLVQHVSFRFNNYFSPLILYPFVFVPILLMLEAFKWKLLIKNIEKISIKQSLTAVLSGISLGIFTPYRLGDYVGRVAFLSSLKRVQGLLACGINSLGLQFSHLIFFYSALTYLAFKEQWIPVLPSYMLVIIFILSSSLTFLAFVNVNLLLPFLSKIKYLSKYTGKLSKSSEFSSPHLASVFLLDLLKVFLYQFQFIIILTILGSEIPFVKLMASISISYFIISLLPTLPIGNFGFKGSIHLFILDNLVEDPFLIIVASLFIWVMNLAIPAIIGNILLIRHKNIGKS